jgi:hypothetical protein
MRLDRQAPSIASRTNVAQKAVLVLEDGTVFRGRGLGAFGQALGEVCFNTSMTGYQEILTDPSYAGQIITFTFPHIGNVCTNDEDVESRPPTCRGKIANLDVWFLLGLDPYERSTQEQRRLTEVMRVLGWRRKIIRHNAQRVGRGFRRGFDTRTIFVMRCPVTKEIYHIGYDPAPSAVNAPGNR